MKIVSKEIIFYNIALLLGYNKVGSIVHTLWLFKAENIKPTTKIKWVEIECKYELFFTRFPLTSALKIERESFEAIS